MFDRTNSRIKSLWGKFRNKEFRESFLTSRLSTNIAAQIQTMREDRGWTQEQLAEASGMAQSRISLLEDPSYERMSVSTLKRLASAFDVGLSIRFVPYSVLLRDAVATGPSYFSVVSFADDTLVR